MGLDLWYHSAVDFVVSHGHMNGIAADTFDPNGTATRAMLVTILHRASGEPKPTAAVPFTDVFAGAWYANAVAWAYNNEIVNGMTETTFAPDNSVTREQVAVILYRFARYSGADVSARADLNEAFTDADDISGYATEALSWAVASGHHQRLRRDRRAAGHRHPRRTRGDADALPFRVSQSIILETDGRKQGSCLRPSHESKGDYV